MGLCWRLRKSIQAVKLIELYTKKGHVTVFFFYK